MANVAVPIEFLLSGLRDSNGEPLGAGKVYTYEPGTTTDRDCWTDSAKSSTAANPIILDANGRVSATHYADGNYDIVVKDTNDVSIITFSNVYFGITSQVPWVDADSYDSFADAITAIGGTDTTLYVNSAQTISANTTIPANVHVVVHRAGSFAISNGIVLTLAGTLSAGAWQIFSGAGSVALNPSACKGILIEWWGDNTTPGTTDMTAEIQAAFDESVATRIPVTPLPEQYLISSTVDIDGLMDIRGAGAKGDGTFGTEFIYTGTTPMFETTAKVKNIDWRDFTVRDTSNGNNNVDVFDFVFGCSRSKFTNIEIDADAGVFRHGWYMRGLDKTSTANANQFNNVWDNCVVWGNDGYCWYLASDDANTADSRWNSNTFINCTTGGSCDVAYYVQGAINRWLGGSINVNTGTYSVVIDSDNAAFNDFFGTNWDNPSANAKPVQFKVDPATSNSPPAQFFGCSAIIYNYSTPHTAPASLVHDYDEDGVSTVIPGRIAIYNTRYQVQDIQRVSGANIEFGVNADADFRLREGSFYCQREYKHDRQITQTKSANYTMQNSDSGRITYVDTASVVLTLPATVIGYNYIIMASDDVTFFISPDSNDKIMGIGKSSVDNKDWSNISAKYGDKLVLIADGNLGWYVQEAIGTWYQEDD